MISVASRLEERLSGKTPWAAGRSCLSRFTAVVALVALLPVWVITAATLWTCLGRPLMFRQTRCGLDAEPFTIWKFRTMHDLRDDAGKLLPDARRQTPVTRIVRHLRVDELPQLLAIARGAMAFVGPRPLLPATIASFGELGRLRCTILPGLTGWAQVNGNTCLSDEEKLALDLWYIQNRSFALDCRILVQTVFVILGGERVNAGNLAKAWATVRALRPLAAGEQP